MDERIWPGLSPAQADGLACVVCAADYLTVASPHVPVGRSASGSQVFACRGRCAGRVAQDEDLARWATVLSLLAEATSGAVRAVLWQAALAEHGTPLVVVRDEAAEGFGPGREESGGEPR